MELTRYLFKVPGVEVFLSRQLSQDSLEQFFGCQRQRGGVHDHPNVKEFMQNTQVLNVVNTCCKRVAKGNCRGNTTDDGIDELDCELLPRRKRRKVQRS